MVTPFCKAAHLIIAAVAQQLDNLVSAGVIVKLDGTTPDVSRQVSLRDKVFDAHEWTAVDVLEDEDRVL